MDTLLSIGFIFIFLYFIYYFNSKKSAKLAASRRDKVFIFKKSETLKINIFRKFVNIFILQHAG